MIDPTPPVASEDAAERFWRLCETDTPPDVDQFLAGAGDISLAARGTILRIDQRCRWQRGERVPVETYLKRHSEIGDDAETTLDLIFNEYLVREQCGDTPDPEEFLRRFPEHSDVLRAQIELHQAVIAEPPDEAGDAAVERGSPIVPEVPGYQILGEIGRGGMGVVYRALQERPQRIVALKMLLSPAHASAERRQRFLAEADAIARLQHPNIVQVYEVGEHEGIPYLILEYVPGGTLARKLGGRPLRARQAAELIETLASAVHYAHQCGVIHRDLKPANILLASRTGRNVSPEKGQPGISPVSEGPTEWSADEFPKISDFGLAKQDRPGLTYLGDVLGTPSYMAPEQTQGDGVGTAADVYALGVILYETLTGRVPFLGASVLETLDQVRNAEPAPPRKLTGCIPRDVETICLKCLEKDPARRYVSAQTLADDCRRYLEGRPVLARPVSRRERLWRWFRRNPLAGSLAGTLGLIVVTTFAGLTMLYLNADAQRNRAEGAEANWIRAATEARAGEAKAVQSQAETKAVLDFFTKKILAAARPKGQEGGLGPQASIRAAMDHAEPGIAKAFAKQPLAEASVRQTLGITYWFMGEYPRAIAQHERELALRRGQLAADDPQTLNAMAHLAQAYQGAGQTRDALRLHEQIFALRKARLGPNDTETLWTMNRLASTLHGLGRLAEAVPLYEEGLMRAKTALGPDHSDTLIYMSYLCIGYRDAGRWAEALPLAQATLELDRAKLGAHHPDTLAAMNHLATILHHVGRFAEAAKLQQETLELRKTILRPDHPETLNSANNLAAVYLDTGRLAEALPLLENALKIERTQEGADHPYTLAIMANLANAYRLAGRLPEACALYQETLRLQNAKVGPDHYKRLIVMNDFGTCLIKMKRFDEALSLLRECQTLRTRKDPADWWILQTKSQLGQALAGLKRSAEAEALLDEAMTSLTAQKDKIPGRYRHFIGEAGEALASVRKSAGG
jgi:serine/threonine protein kinase/tetratricopeptide (TPR) repeat protein